MEKRKINKGIYVYGTPSYFSVWDSIALWTKVLKKNIKNDLHKE